MIPFARTSALCGYQNAHRARARTHRCFCFCKFSCFFAFFEKARFARVQPLDSISPRPSATGGASYSATVAGAASAAIRNKSGGAGADATLDRLEMPTAETALPSAEAVWSPILALRTFVEPLTTRASSALRSFHISFHGEGEVDAGTGDRKSVV